MLELKKIAITGGISSGKTAVCRILKNHGAYQLNSDEIIHKLLSTHFSCIEQIINLLGPEILTKGKIDRKKVADVIFSSPSKLQAVEKILHPLLFKEIEKEYQKVKETGRFSLFVVEMPLVQEIGKTKYFDVIVAVISEEKIARERFLKKGFSKDEYDRRMKRHWPIEKKEKYAHYTINNNGNLEDLEKEVVIFLHKIM